MAAANPDAISKKWVLLYGSAQPQLPYFRQTPRQSLIDDDCCSTIILKGVGIAWIVWVASKIIASRPFYGF